METFADRGGAHPHRGNRGRSGARHRGGRGGASRDRGGGRRRGPQGGLEFGVSDLEDGGLETLGKNAVEFGVAVPQLVAALREALNKVGRGRHTCLVCPVKGSFLLTAVSHKYSLRASDSVTRTL
jgi:hypothetical protein